MHCDEVVRELATPTPGSGSGRDGRTPGRLPGLCRMGPAGRAARSALGSDPSRRALARGLGRRLGPVSRQALPCPAANRRAASASDPSRNGSGLRSRIRAAPAPAPAGLSTPRLAPGGSPRSPWWDWPRPPPSSWPSAWPGRRRLAPTARGSPPDVAATPHPTPRGHSRGDPVASPVKVDVEIQEGRLILIPASGASWVAADRAVSMITGRRRVDPRRDGGGPAGGLDAPGDEFRLGSRAGDAERDGIDRHAPGGGRGERGREVRWPWPCRDDGPSGSACRRPRWPSAAWCSGSGGSGCRAPEESPSPTARSSEQVTVFAILATPMARPWTSDRRPRLGRGGRPRGDPGGGKPSSFRARDVPAAVEPAAASRLQAAGRAEPSDRGGRIGG